MKYQEKLSLCDKCPHMVIDGSDSIFEGEKNDRYCLLLKSLIRPYLNSQCPDNRW